MKRQIFDNDRRVYLMVIIRRKDGYFVISEKGKKKLGGPYKKREDAVHRLQQVEYFKRIGR
jgi:archaeosine-15-forming tRNA-guanine transglycosylase